MGGAFSKLVYLVLGSGLILFYLGLEVRGAVFSATDSRPSVSSGRSSGHRGTSSTRRRGSGGVFLWGSGGYRGGK